MGWGGDGWDGGTGIEENAATIRGKEVDVKEFRIGLQTLLDR